MPKTSKPVNTLMDEHQYGVLVDLACIMNCSRGAVIRHALRNMEAMIILKTPTCANGQRCFTPHMHAPAGPAAPTA